jgi:RNA-binding protein 26
MGLAADIGKVATPSSSSPTPVSALHDEMLTDKNKSGDTIVSHSPKTSTTTALQQSPSLKQQTIRPLAPLGTPVPPNRYKLDNRPTGFRILPPLPSGFANVSLFLSLFEERKILFYFCINSEPMHLFLHLSINEPMH